jgi:hypothetical protein
MPITTARVEDIRLDAIGRLEVGRPEAWDRLMPGLAHLRYFRLIAS